MNPSCFLCEKGFPRRDDGIHYGTQSLGMIPDRRCEALVWGMML